MAADISRPPGLLCGPPLTPPDPLATSLSRAMSCIRELCLVPSVFSLDWSLATLAPFYRAYRHGVAEGRVDLLRVGAQGARMFSWR